ncbi:PIG-L family deacetylase [Parabacteroides sp. OttesenSCG-928-K15]|nr:PIG-L family deacetylase [Parabacteroides sp. OttesenSCG-928-K15]
MKREIRTSFLKGMINRIYVNQRNSTNPVSIKSFDMKNILIIAPHADDEVIGCGGLIQHCTKINARVTVLIVTKEGKRSISGSSLKPEKRIAESFNAKETLKYSELTYLSYSELELEQNEGITSDLREKIEHFIQSKEIDSIFIPNDKERHPDHRITSRTCQHILTSKIYKSVKYIFKYEVWGPVMMNSYLILDKNMLETKIAAMNEYKTQLETVDYVEIILSINRKRGNDILQTTNSEATIFAEGYELIYKDEN